MFDVGKRYTITMLEDSSGRTVSSGWLVTRVEGPLIEVTRGDERLVINTTSAAFVQAELSQNQSGEPPVIEITSFAETASYS